jgi:hypothetical protein
MSAIGIQGGTEWISPLEISRWIHQAASGVAFLHKNRVAHGEYVTFLSLNLCFFFSVC